MFEMLVGYIVALFLFQPLNVFIHEAGHAAFARAFGGKVEKIEIGIGDPLFAVGKYIQVNKVFFMMGMLRYDNNLDQDRHKIRLSFVALGGVLFNLLSIAIVIIFKVYTNHHHFLDGYFFGFTAVLIISALIPVTYSTGYDSDGKWLAEIWKRENTDD
ncbi:site-2 protease family protein [Jeotgalibacillus terrae]|uniref:Site-2 protease family protein n=1 Tax=Jeotgalibacillus terrae TaxID=587735 RepID=A0ABW5ZJL3_9BACL|nr:M50 family metallopeptidase [Jeotgalibacillus terrae]MBM7578643.1 membrane-associated protease RseP (regulator of RpoE activity) [Jeotgalibacillus terrae]